MNKSNSKTKLRNTIVIVAAVVLLFLIVFSIIFNVSNNNNSNSPYNYYQQIHKLSSQVIQEEMSEDGYYDFESYNKLSYNHGYQIIYYPNGTVDEDDYNDTVVYLKQRSSDSRVGIKKVKKYVYASFNLEDKDEAIDLARVYGDGHVWDWANNTEVENINALKNTDITSSDSRDDSYGATAKESDVKAEARKHATSGDSEGALYPYDE